MVPNMASQGTSFKKSFLWQGNAISSNAMPNKIEKQSNKFNENLPSVSDSCDKAARNSGCAFVGITCYRQVGKKDTELMLTMDHNRGLLSRNDKKNDVIFPCCCPNNQMSRSKNNIGQTRLSSESGDDMENYYNTHASDVIGSTPQSNIRNGHKSFVSNLTSPILNMAKCLEFKESNGSAELLDKSNLTMLRNFRLESNSLDNMTGEGDCDQGRKSICTIKNEPNEHCQDQKESNGLLCGRSTSTSSADPSSSVSILQSPDMDFLDFDFDPTPNGDDFFSSMIDTDYDTASNQDLEDDLSFANEVANNLSDTVNADVQDKFVHSLSFHNQLSSPKFQNTSIGEISLNNSFNESIGNNDKINISENDDSTPQSECSNRNSLNISSEEHLIEDSHLSLQNASITNKSIKKSSLTTLEDTHLAYDNISNLLLKPLEKVMVWSETEAFSFQVAQIGTSACGATAVINVLNALKQEWDKEKVVQAIHTRLRNEKASIPEYLFSRSVAGTTHEDLIQGIEEISRGCVYGKFFAFYPPRKVDLSRWLAHWLKKGAVPIATLNLQKGVAHNQIIPDAWHHQMIFGVGPRGIYLTNPLECVPETIILQQLCCDSVLLIRKEDIIIRWENGCDLHPLIQHSDVHWRELNVLGQVVNVLREWTSSVNNPNRRPLVTHIAIPAAYKAGITLFISRNSESFQELADSSELPVC